MRAGRHAHEQEITLLVRRHAALRADDGNLGAGQRSLTLGIDDPAPDRASALRRPRIGGAQQQGCRQGEARE